jgi:hypothetical protein
MGKKLLYDLINDVLTAHDGFSLDNPEERRKLAVTLTHVCFDHMDNVMQKVTGSRQRVNSDNDDEHEI